MRDYKIYGGKIHRWLPSVNLGLILEVFQSQPKSNQIPTTKYKRKNRLVVMDRRCQTKGTNRKHKGAGGGIRTPNSMEIARPQKLPFFGLKSLLKSYKVRICICAINSGDHSYALHNLNVDGNEHSNRTCHH